MSPPSSPIDVYRLDAKHDRVILLAPDGFVSLVLRENEAPQLMACDRTGTTLTDKPLALADLPVRMPDAMLLTGGGAALPGNRPEISLLVRYRAFRRERIRGAA